MRRSVNFGAKHLAERINMTDLPQDIQKKWHNVTRRMQSVAKSEGLSIISLKVLVKANGEPVTWQIDRHLLEPKSLQETLLSLVEND